MNELRYEILDEKRRALLPLFSDFSDRFYLAGGTGLALQIGHRDSIDFDFFSQTPFETAAVFEQCVQAFPGSRLVKTQDERDTLAVVLDDAVSISFLGFPYPLVEPLAGTAELPIASIADIGCMKLSAITSRATLKDYVDIFFILRILSLSTLLSYTAGKFPSLDRNLILKSLVYFEDITDTAIRFTPSNEVSLDELRNTLQGEVKEFLEQSAGM